MNMPKTLDLPDVPGVADDPVTLKRVYDYDSTRVPIGMYLRALYVGQVAGQTAVIGVGDSPATIKAKEVDRQITVAAATPYEIRQAKLSPECKADCVVGDGDIRMMAVIPEAPGALDNAAKQVFGDTVARQLWRKHVMEQERRNEQSRQTRRAAVSHGR